MLIDPKHPFYAPLWRRILIVLVPLGWGAFELSHDNAGWGAAFICAGLYAAVTFVRSGSQK